MSGTVGTSNVGVSEAGGFLVYVPPDVIARGGSVTGPVSTFGVGIDANGTLLRYLAGQVVPEPEPDPPVNIGPPQASGVGGFAQGTLVICGNGTWSGGVPRTYTHQWRVSPGGADIPGATANSWTIAGHEGEMVEDVVTASNSDGSASAVSNAVGPILPAESPP